MVFRLGAKGGYFFGEGYPDATLRGEQPHWMNGKATRDSFVFEEWFKLGDKHTFYRIMSGGPNETGEWITHIMFTRLGKTINVYMNKTESQRWSKDHLEWIKSWW